MTSPAAEASPPDPPRPASRGRFAALRHRDFTLLWAGNIVSRIGTQMRDVALAWQIYVLTHSPLKLGLIGAARVIPIIALALGGGVAADTFDRRRVMMITQTILALTSTAMAVLTWRGWMTEQVVYGCIALSAAANAFDAPARQAIVTNVLPDEDLPNGLSLSFTAIQLATVIGPGLGGMMLELSSIEVIYAIDAISYLSVLAALATIRPLTRREPDKGEGGARVRAGALGEGIRFLLQKPVLIWLMLLDFLATFFAGSLLLLPIFANEIFNVGKVGLGWLSAAPSMGAVLAGAWLSWRPPMRRYGPAVLGAVVAYGACVAAFGATSWLFKPASALPLALLFLAGSGAADTVSTVVRQVVRQTLTPDALRGRMTGVNMIFFIGGPQLGEVEAGVVAQLSSAQLSVVSGGIACMVGAALLGAFVPVLRQLRAEEQKDG